MQEWSIHVTIQYAGTRSDIEDATETYLDVLLENRYVLGPATSADFRTGTVGALFQIEAPSHVAAMKIAARIVPNSLQRAFSGGSHAYELCATSIARNPEHALLQGYSFSQAS